MLLPLLALLADGSFDPVTFLVNYGVAGIFLALLATGQFRTKAEVISLQKVVEERAKALAEMRGELAAKEQALQALMLQITQQTLPSLTQTAKLVERIPVHKPMESELVLMRRLEALADRLEAAEKGGEPGA